MNKPDQSTSSQQMTHIGDTLASKLMHSTLIILIVIYVVFVKKPSHVVESVS